MKQYCLFILTFYLVLTIQYARSETYKEWYDKYVRNCTAGSAVKSYKANTVCICSMPGVIESCKYIGSMKESSAAVLRLSAWYPHVGMEEGSTAYCYNAIGSHFDGCNWCECRNTIYYCTSLPCTNSTKPLKKSSVNGLQPTEREIDFYKPGPSKCKKSFLHEDGCNWCHRTNGWEMCTTMLCPKKKKTLANKVSSDCKNNPRGKFSNDDGCNWCYCINENTPICTRMLCDKRNNMKPRKLSNECEGKPSGRFLADDGCNWCYCIDGVPMCTVISCLVPQVTLTKKLSASMCNHRIGHFYIDCNICYCTTQGQAVCTVMKCPPKKEAQSDDTVKRDKLKKVDDASKLCKEGYKGSFYDDCNVCYCNNIGQAVCTLLLCPSKQEGQSDNTVKRVKLKKVDDASKLCKEGYKGSFYDDCNVCYCNNIGQAVCTLLLCPSKQEGQSDNTVKRVNRKKVDDASKLCKEGYKGSFYDDCNVCYCNNIGQAVCTLLLCPSKQEGESDNTLKRVELKKVEDARKLCKEGYKGSFYLDCNICHCTNREQASCTRKMCHPKKKGSANSALLNGEVKPNKKKLYALKEKAQGCKSGEKFKEPYGCNWCNCIEDGVVVCDTNTCH